jgi:hypothetical protein
VKEVLERLRTQYLFTTFLSVDRSVIKTRKQMSIFMGVDSKSYYHLIFSVAQKSRFLQKHALEISSFHEHMVLHVNHNYKYKHLFLEADICSKARVFLENEGWKVYHDCM